MLNYLKRKWRKSFYTLQRQAVLHWTSELRQGVLRHCLSLGILLRQLNKMASLSVIQRVFRIRRMDRAFRTFPGVKGSGSSKTCILQQNIIFVLWQVPRLVMGITAKVKCFILMKVSQLHACKIFNSCFAYSSLRSARISGAYRAGGRVYYTGKNRINETRYKVDQRFSKE